MSNSRLRIAIIEDDPVQRRSITAMLDEALRTRHSGAGPEDAPLIREFESALDLLPIIDEASKAPDEFPFDVVIADVFMPMPGGSTPHPQGGAVRIYDEIKKASLSNRVIMVIISIDILGAENDVGRILDEQRNLESQWAFVLSKPRTVSVTASTAGISREAWMSTIEMLIAHREDRVFRAKAFLRLPTSELLSQPFFAGVKMEVDALVRSGSPPFLCITGERGTPKEAVAQYFARRLERSDVIVPFTLRGGAEDTITFHLFGRELPEPPREGYLELHPTDTVLIQDFCLPSQHRAKIDNAVLGLVKSMRERQGASSTFYRTDGGFEPKEFAGVLIVTCERFEDLRKSSPPDEVLVDLLESRHVHIPSLRESPDHIGPLATHFLSTAIGERRFTGDGIDALRGYRWPRNIEELEEIIGSVAGDPELPVWIGAFELHSAGLPGENPQESRRSEIPMLEKGRKKLAAAGRYIHGVWRAKTPLQHMLRTVAWIVGALVALSALLQGLNATYDLRCKIDPSACVAKSRLKPSVLKPSVKVLPHDARLKSPTRPAAR
jgi:CheY-like chemotaxis protein